MTLTIRHKGTAIAKVVHDAGRFLEALMPDLSPTKQHGRYRLTRNLAYTGGGLIVVYLWADETTVTVEN